MYAGVELIVRCSLPLAVELSNEVILRGCWFASCGWWNAPHYLTSTPLANCRRPGVYCKTACRRHETNFVSEAACWLLETRLRA